MDSVINNSGTEIIGSDDSSQISLTLSGISSNTHRSDGQSKKSEKKKSDRQVDSFSLSSCSKKKSDKKQSSSSSDDFSSSSGSMFDLSSDDFSERPEKSEKSKVSNSMCESCKPGKESSSCQSCKPGDLVPSKASAFIYDGKNVRYNSARDVPYNAPLLVGSRKLSGNKKDKGFNPELFVFDPKSGNLYQGASNSIKDGHAVTVLSSSGVQVKRSKNVAVLGVERGYGAREFCNMNNALITQKLFALEHLTVGPIPDGVLDDGVFLVTGNAEIRGDLTVENLKAESLEVETANIVNLQSHSTFLAGEGGATGTTVILRPSDNYDIVYVNSAGGTLNIQLGESSADVFRPNQEITFKDTNPEFGAGPSYNTNIYVTEGDTRIEHYSGEALVACANAGYAINTGGGAVTFRYADFGVPGSHPTWVIVNQFTGNPREVPIEVDPIPPASQEMRARVLGH